MTDAFYSTRRLDAILREWPHWEALAETPASARHLLQPDRKGPTPEAPRTSRSGQAGDPMRFADVVADVQHAITVLDEFGARVVTYRMHGCSLEDIARGLCRRDRDVRHAYWDAVDTMAISLGGATW